MRNVCDDCISFARCPLDKGRESCGLHAPIPALLKRHDPAGEEPLSSVRDALSRYGIDFPEDGSGLCD